MAYIVDLTVILHRLFESRCSVSAENVRSAMMKYAKSIPRDRNHQNIMRFATQNTFTYQNRDTIVEKIVDLIRRNCVRITSRDSD